MHVLFLADGLFPFVVGGMQKHSTMLIKHLSPLVDQITVCTCGEINAPPPAKQEILDELLTSKNNIQVLTCTFEDKGVLPGHYLRASRKLSLNYLNLVGDLSQYDCVYAQGLAGDAFLEKHNRVVVNLHGLEMFQLAFSTREALAKRLMRPHFRRQIQQAWKLVSLGGRLGELLKANGAREEQVVVLPNGVDDDWFDWPKSRRRDGQLRFLMVGRHEYRKGFHILAQALTLLEKPIELHLVGDWPEIEATLHRVTHHGVVRDKRRLIGIIDSCDVLLLPSLSEGMPTVVLEAKARGLKVVGTNVGAMSDIETNLLERGNVCELAKAIKNCKLSDVDRLPERYKWARVARSTVLQMA